MNSGWMSYEVDGRIFRKLRSQLMALRSSSTKMDTASR
jgi:hypothetical protein